MPVSWIIEDGLVLLTSDGVATLEEWQAALGAAFQSHLSRPGMAVVSDLRRIDRVPSPDEARLRVSWLTMKAKEHGIRRWATVAKRPAVFGMTRLAEAYSDSEHVEFRAFGDFAEAVAWARDSIHQQTG